MLEKIQNSLKQFSHGNLTKNARDLFQTLGYESTRQQPFENKSFADFAEYITNEVRFSEKNAFANEWKYVDLLFQLTETELSNQNLIFSDNSINQRIVSYLFFTIELKESSYNRTKLSQITREVNKVFQIPVMILFKYGEFLTLSVIDRRPNKFDENKDVLLKITLIKDINFQNPHRAHIDNLFDLSLGELQKKNTITNFLSLHNAWQKTLDVELVTNKFFRDYKIVFEKVEQEIEKNISDKETARLFNQRLFNRLMFVYFVQKKGWLEFEGNKNYLRSLFSKADANEENFYKDRLFYVFFYGLSNIKDSKEIHEDERLRKIRGEVPYLNGGLFETEKDGFDERGKVSIPNSFFADILNLFEKYNFTVEESTPLEVQVAIDPEILGRVFEELVTGRHESGSYYTPRQIVSFMCRESLKHYLAPHESAENIAQFVDDGNSENIQNPERILDELKKIRICDPACGSGAYLLGMMQELLRLRESLFASKHIGDASHYNRKREIIENNIYGVDKDRFAVQIASLRLWLSLAIESEEPRPLPNLKYKIGCGDALLAPLDNDLQQDLHRRARIEQFRARKAEYAKAFEYTEKREIEIEIERLRIEIAQSLHHLPEPPKPFQITLAESNIQPLRDKIQRCVNRGEKSDAERFQKDLNKLLASIEEWKQQIEPKPYAPDYFDWTVEFAEVFTDGGFDVVLANPPYVQQEDIDKQDKPKLLKIYETAMTGKSDLFVAFYARALQITKISGTHVFVCSNSWLDVGYGRKMQDYLLKNAHVSAIYDSAVERQFSTAKINTIISFIQKETPTDEDVTKFVSLRAPFAEAIADENKRRTVTKTRRELIESGANENGKYEGDKWGGKFLRAPDIYFTTLEKGKDKLVRLSKICNVSGYIHDNNTGASFPSVPFLKTIKNVSQIYLSKSSPEVILFGVKPDGNSRLVSPLLFPRTFGTRHIVIWNPDGVFGKEFYKILPKNTKQNLSVAAQMNNTFTILQRELIGLANLGDGALKFSANDVGKFLLIENLSDISIEEKFLKLSKRAQFDIHKEIEQPDRRDLDDIIFDALGLTSGEREAVYEAVIDLVSRRLKKARTITS